MVKSKRILEQKRNPKGRMKSFIRGILIFFLCANGILYATEQNIKIKSESVSYSEEGRIMTAKGNVVLETDDLKVTADYLKMDIDNNRVWSTGNIWIKKGENEFKTSAILLNLEENIATLNQINIEIVPPENKGNILLSADVLTDTPSKKYGKRGILTTCTNPESPHHYIYADEFIYTPNKRFVIKRGYFVNKFLVTPLPFKLPLIGNELSLPILIPIPYYSYALGTRKIVWNFPTIGKLENRPGWGWFVQNSIDYKYKNNKESSLYLDFFQDKDDIKRSKYQFGEWGLGIGINHFYEWEKQEGNITAYRYDFDIKNELGQFEPKKNETLGWKNTYQITPYWSLNHEIISKKVEEHIQIRAKEESLYTKLGANYDNLGDIFQITGDQLENNTLKSNAQTLKLNRTFNNKHRYSLDLNKRQDTFKELDLDATLKQTLYFPNRINLYNTANLKEISQQNQDPNRKLDLNSTLVKTFNRGRLSIYWNQLYQLQPSNNIRLNDYLAKEPEITLDLNPYKIGFFTVKQDATMARYREFTFDPKTNDRRIFPKEKFEIIPNTYIYNQTISVWKANFVYNQYAFKQANTGLFDGDAQYRLQANVEGYRQEFLWGLFATGTLYHYQYSAENNNNPYTLGVTQLKGNRNDIVQTLDFQFDKYPNYGTFTWTNSFPYNWLEKPERKWGSHLYTIEMTLFNNRASLQANGSKKMNFTDAEKSTRFEPLFIQAQLKPSWIEINYNLYVNMNKWVDESDFFVQGSTLQLGFNLGRDVNYQWQFRADFFYKDPTGLGKVELKNYDLNTLSLVKKEHERELSLSYTKSTETWFITYRFFAFPDDPFQIRKTKELLEIEGKFKQNAQERL